MADRRRNRDLPHFDAMRDASERFLRAVIVVGAIVGWGLVALAYFAGG